MNYENMLLFDSKFVSKFELYFDYQISGNLSALECSSFSVLRSKVIKMYFILHGIFEDKFEGGFVTGV